VKVYKLTAAGRKRLTQERTRWEQITDAIAGVLNPAKKENQP
jgi:DNA-binding PadR family transcriptional regulator